MPNLKAAYMNAHGVASYASAGNHSIAAVHAGLMPMTEPEERKLILAVLFAAVLIAAAMTLPMTCGCLGSGAKGIEAPISVPIASKSHESETTTGVDGDSNWVTTITVQGGALSVAAALGLSAAFGYRHRAEKRLRALDRCVQGIEECGPDCAAKHHVRNRGISRVENVDITDSTEKIINERVRKLTKGQIGRLRRPNRTAPREPDAGLYTDKDGQPI